MNHKKMITNKDRLLHQEKKYEEALYTYTSIILRTILKEKAF